MARYLWQLSGSSGGVKRSMRIGSVSNPTSYGTPASYTFTIDGVSYTVKIGYFTFYTSVLMPYTFPGYTWLSSDQFGSSSSFSIWISEALTLSVKAYNTASKPNVTVGELAVNGTTYVNAVIGLEMGLEVDYEIGIFALKGVLDGVSGIFITYKATNEPDNDETLRSKQFIFIPDALWELSDEETPFNPDETENSGGTPDGGFGGGSANSGGSSGAGSAPDHPIKQGAGIHYMLVTDAQLQDFSDKMWGRGGALFDDLWSRWKDYKFNPMAGILTCHALPTAFYPSVGGAASSISIAGTTVPVSCTLAGVGIMQQTYTQDLSGLLSYANFLDYMHTKIYAHVPFCGVCEIPTSACVGGSVAFTFRCDVLTGNIACWIMAYDRFGAEHQINCLTGNCAYTVPITGNDNGMSAIVGAMTNNIVATIGSVDRAVGGIASGSMPNVNGQMLDTSTRGSLQMAASQHHTQVSANLAGSVSIVANTVLFLEMYFASPSFPSTMQSVRGTLSDRGGTVGAYSGTFTVFSDVHADGINFATDTEKNEIERMLKDGVYV